MGSMRSVVVLTRQLLVAQALSDAQQFLFEERQRLLLLQAENDELKLQEIQDRQRIQQLLAMTQPLEQTITFKQVCLRLTCWPCCNSEAALIGDS